MRRRLFIALREIQHGLASIARATKLRLIWRIGKNVRFSGPVHVRSCSGLVFIGDNCIIGPHVQIEAARGAELRIGKGVSLNQGSFVVARSSIRIGDNCLIGEYVSIRDNDHEWRDPSLLIREQGFSLKPVVIANDVWIGRGACIQKGVSIGQGAVVGANAVVTKDVEEFAVVAGVPARLIATRKLAVADR